MSLLRVAKVLVVAAVLIGSVGGAGNLAGASPTSHATYQVDKGATGLFAFQGPDGKFDEPGAVRDDLEVSLDVNRLPVGRAVEVTLAADRTVVANCVTPFAGQVAPPTQRVSSEPQVLVTDANGSLTAVRAVLHTGMLGDVCPRLASAGDPILVTDYEITYSDVVITLTLSKWTSAGGIEEEVGSIVATVASGDHGLFGLTCTVETHESGHCNTY